jgi:hypothetical protein
VGARGGDLQRPAGLVLASDVGEVLDRRHRGFGRRPGTAQIGPADQPLADLLERGGTGDRQAGDEGGLDQVGLGYDQEPGARPARRQRAGSTPLTARTSPPRPSSPIARRPSRATGGTHRAAASSPIAIDGQARRQT